MQQHKKLAAVTALALICASAILGCSAYTPVNGDQVITLLSSDTTVPTITPTPTAAINATSTNSTSSNSTVSPSPTLEPTVSPAVIEITGITAVVTIAAASIVMLLVKRHDKSMEK